RSGWSSRCSGNGSSGTSRGRRGVGGRRRWWSRSSVSRWSGHLRGGSGRRTYRGRAVGRASRLPPGRRPGAPPRTPPAPGGGGGGSGGGGPGRGRRGVGGGGRWGGRSSVSRWSGHLRGGGGRRTYRGRAVGRASRLPRGAARWGPRGSRLARGGVDGAGIEEL